MSKSPRRRARNPLLSQFYGLPSAEPTTPEAPAPEASNPVAQSPLDINSETFDASAYYEALLQEKTVAEMLRIDQSLGTAIRRLDNGMKTLVYENYNKFIRATETIRDMKANMTSMEDQMALLAQKVDRISELSGSIDTTLAGRRDQIEDLSSVSRLLHGRQFLFDLPSRLQRDLEMGAFGDAVKYYTKTRHIFEQHASVASFSSISRDCEQIMGTVKTALVKQLRSGEASLQAVADAAVWLMQLGESFEDIESIVLQRYQVRIDTSLDKYRAALAKVQAAEDDALTAVGEREEAEAHGSDSGKQEASSDDDCVNGISQEERGEEGHVMDGESGRHVTQNALDETSSVASQVQLLGTMVLPELIQQVTYYHQAFIAMVDPDDTQRSRAIRNLNRYVQHVLDLYYESVVPLLEEGSDALEVLQGIECIHKALEMVNAKSPDLPLDAKVQHMVRCAIRSHVDRDFAVARERCDELLASIVGCGPGVGSSGGVGVGVASGSASTPPSTPIPGAADPTRSDAAAASGCGPLVIKMATLLDHVLDNLKPFVTVSDAMRFLTPHCGHIVGAVFTQCRQLLTHLCQTCVSMALTDEQCGEDVPLAQQQAHTRSILILGLVCMKMKDELVASVEQSLEVLSLLANQEPSVSDLKGHAARAAMEGAAMQLLQRYARRLGHQLAKMMDRGIRSRDWLSEDLGVPRNVRVVAKMWMQEFDSCASDVRSVMQACRDEDATSHASPDSNRSLLGESRFTSGLEHEMARLFRDSVQVYAPVEWRMDSVLSAVAKMGLKAAVEAVRMQTFAKHGLQQIQVDTAYVKACLTAALHSKRHMKPLASLCQEIVSSCTDRCVDPNPLDSSIVESIVGKEGSDAHVNSDDE